MGGTMMLLDVVAIHVHESVEANGEISLGQHQTLGKMGGDGYSVAKEDAVLARPVLNKPA